MFLCKEHPAPRYPVIVLVLFFLFSNACSIFPVQARNPYTLDPKLLDSAEKKYGQSAKNRLLAWQELMQHKDHQNDLELLNTVNSFFNTMAFVDDIDHWQQKDYWATPVEFLASNGGDCEDFSLAKYFTLKKMGIAESKLSLTYVTSLTLKQAHMVVTYYESPGAEPLVLDNLVKEIKPASQRSDLLPVYSFNGTGLWLAKARGRGHLVGDSTNLKRWQDLIKRMPEGFAEDSL